MTDSDHRRWEDDLAAYALGALDGPDRGAFEAHLDGCERCREHLREASAAVELLPASVEQIAPPPALRRRLLAAARADAAAETVVRRPSGARAAHPRRLRVVALAAVATVAAATVTTGYLVRGDDGSPSVTVPADALRASTAVRAALVREDERWQLAVERLPRLPAGSVYEVWVHRGTALHPSTRFVLARDGRAKVDVPQSLRRGDEVLVTREPQGGSKVPTTAPLLRAQV